MCYALPDYQGYNIRAKWDKFNLATWNCDSQNTTKIGLDQEAL